MLITVSALLGLVVGSFLNVVAYRIPTGRSVVRPPSACPACGRPVRPRDNVPVFSWLALRGRCRDCGAPISARYPLVEAGTALAFAAVAAHVGAKAVLPAYLWFAAVSIVFVLTDLDHHRLPNAIMAPATIGGLLLLGIGSWLDGALDGFLRGIGAGVAYFAGLLLLAVVARGGFGMGDVKLAFLLGLYAGYVSWTAFVVGVFMAFFIGGFVSLVLLATRRRGRKDAIPFGPALLAGTWVGIVWGEAIARWYLG